MLVSSYQKYKVAQKLEKEKNWRRIPRTGSAYQSEVLLLKNQNEKI